MASNLRIQRLNHTYMEEISIILMEEVKDEDLKNVIEEYGRKIENIIKELKEK